jgi:pimeloyl-ACP methyl ester carboxylesterase
MRNHRGHRTAASEPRDPGSRERLPLAAPRTIMLIHGLWTTPRCWELFRRYYEECRYRVLAPAWPRLCGEVEDMRRDPSRLAGLGLVEIIAHYEAAIRLLDEAPILIGHSLGGLVVQLLLDRGLGAAGIAIDSPPPRGVWQLSLSQFKSLLPVFSDPFAYWQTVSLTYRQFRYAFANAMSEGEARAAFTLYTIPAPGRPVFEAAFANLIPRSATTVDYANGERAPLLLVSGADDRIVPPSVVRANHRRCGRSKAITSFKEFPGHSHLIIAEDGWQQIAEFALSWAQQHGRVGFQRSNRSIAMSQPLDLHQQV